MSHSHTIRLIINCAAFLPVSWWVIPLSAGEAFRFVDGNAKTVEAFLYENFDDRNFGMVVGLLDEHGSRVYSAGKLDNATDRSVDGDTLFEIGSVTKVFTALLLLEAAQRGEVNVDDPVAKYLPKTARMPARNGKEIKLINLAAQDSGLPNNPTHPSGKAPEALSLEERKELVESCTVDDLYTFASGHQLAHDPGERFIYSNVGMAILGQILMQRTGKDYESLVVDRICRPLKMESTCITLTHAQRDRLATSHLDDGVASERLHLKGMVGSGALLSTANDLLRFLSATLALTETHLKSQMEEMQKVRHTNSTEFGRTATPWWDQGVYNPPGADLLGHAGGTYGSKAFIGFDKAKRRGVVVLTNQARIAPNNVGWVLLQEVPLVPENIVSLVREVIGIGVAVESDKASGLLRVSHVFPNSSAGKAGLSKGLLVQTINDVSVERKALADCLTMLAVPNGTKVRLDLFDPEVKQNRTVELTRRKFITRNDKPRS